VSTLLLQSVLAGIVNGFVYALIGIGLAVIFRGSRIINAMQGEFAVVGAIAAALFIERLHWLHGLSFVAGIVAAMVIGAGVELLFVRAMEKRNPGEEGHLLLTIGLALAFSAGVLVFAGREPHLLPPIGQGRLLDTGEATLPEHALYLVGAALLTVIVLQLFYRRTHFGLSMLAASSDADGATTVGINVAMMRTCTFAIGGGLGAIAGLLVAPLVPISYESGLVLTLKGAAAAILGGLNNPKGAVVGGLVLGLAESLAIVGVSSGYKDVVAMLLLIAVMIVFPNGLLAGAQRKGG
jgi:branched-chain amino acid transport system permease protein